MNITNENLINDIRKNNANALNNFLIANNTLIEKSMKKYDLDRDTIEDCIYRVIINENLSINNLTAYLWAVIRNEKSKELKRLSLANSTLSLDFKSFEPDNVSSEIIFDDLIKDFDKETKSFIILKFKYGYTYREIATIHDVSKSFVFKRVKEACELLRKQLI